MSLKRLIVAPEAFEDLRLARQWYESRRLGLGAAFDLAIEATLSRIPRLPQSYPIALPPFRRVVVRRFPYEVFYRDSDDIVIVQVIHTAQNPERILARLRSH